jgi:pyruvate/2-oxoglutarate dehydrogenase complex dihydrolipoamide acyltransferase (E2) component
MQVAGFERNQLSSLFAGIMSHLLAHVSDTVQQQQQQQQQQESAGAAADRQSARSSRRQAGKMNPAEPAAAAAAAAAAVDVQAYCQQVAAALAAHVSARVPISSSLVPHVLHILGPQVRRLLCCVAVCGGCMI